MHKVKLALVILFTFSAGPATGQDILERAFPNLAFDRPVALRNAGDGTDLLYIVEQTGKIQAFPNEQSATMEDVSELLDISDWVFFEAEPGLLGLAFHPDFATNRKFYVYFVMEGATSPYRARVSQFAAPPASEFDRWGEYRDEVRASEVRLLDIERTDWHHNGGDLHFGLPEGPDGERYLYVSLGDGACCGDPERNGQDLTTLEGSILRLDVDTPASGLNYGIPPDNPFAGNPEGWREEIWAYGFRNPWRFSVDSQTGALWVGDVGEVSWEEINYVERGKNYGWNTVEGPDCFEAEECDMEGMEVPLLAIPHSDALAITGGYIYQGQRAPALQGQYIFADWGFRKLWALSYDPQVGGEPDSTQLSAFTGLFVSSFGEDEAGELYLVNTFNGDIFWLAENLLSSEGGGQSEASPTLRAAFPNPFTSATTLTFELAAAGPVRLAVYDVLGREVAVLYDGPAPVGEQTVRFGAEGHAAGVYVARMTAGGTTFSRTLTLAR